jgi:3-mercaptopyruvate sulfurtransferase SseA
MKKITLAATAALLCTVSLQAGFFDGFQDRIKAIKAMHNLKHDQRDYRYNKSGLVNALQAAKWINNWEENKPANVNGRLFVMQVGRLPGKIKYVKHDNINVFTFDRTAGCTGTGDTRNDGISDIPMPIFGGGAPNGMDGAFWAYDINPLEDMLLVVVASDEPKNMALATRFLWTMNYWGMKKDHIAIMNGTAMYMFDPKLNPEIRWAGVSSKESMFTENGSEVLMAPGGPLDFGNEAEHRPPATRYNFRSIKELPAGDQFELFASMEDMMDVVDAADRNNVIIDGRGAAEYNADVETKRSKTESEECGVNHDKPCYSAIEGHIKGAVNLEYRGVINTEDYVKDLNGDGVVDSRDSSMTFKSKRELKRTFRKLGVKRGSDVYTYCRTGTRASLITYASFEIMGYKTHMYDGSWIQWSKMADATDTYGAEMLPSDSPWRVDVAQYTEGVTYNDSIDVGPASSELHPYAGKGEGNKIFEEDYAYRYGGSPE